eukprot:738845-Alexandrium_andersonii.AAC.1
MCIRDRAAEVAGLFGSDAVAAAAPYLGATATPPAGEGVLRRGHWCPEAVRAAKAGAWDGPCAKVQSRAATIAAVQGGAARRAAQWNTFVVACV